MQTNRYPPIAPLAQHLPQQQQNYHHPPPLNNCFDSRDSLNDLAGQLPSLGPSGYALPSVGCASLLGSQIGGIPPRGPGPYGGVGGNRMAVITEIEDHEHKIVTEFDQLLETSRQLFNGLRDLPQHGHKQWQVYFGRTFDVYTKLWKFQQQHRQILDSKYGLKRWQIGEIASKIGQLYYHF